MKSKADFKIREIKNSELPVLEDILYEAIFYPEGAEPPPRDVIKTPEIKAYIEDFPRADDCCFVAEVKGRIIGAVWVRVLSGKIKGYGYVDEKTPEFAISLYKEYRNKGIGTVLMKYMIEHLRTKGYCQTSLSVDKRNYAVNMYKTLGFIIIKERDHDYLMLLRL